MYTNCLEGSSIFKTIKKSNNMIEILTPLPACLQHAGYLEEPMLVSWKPISRSIFSTPFACFFSRVL